MASMMAQRAEMPAADADYPAQSKSGSVKVIVWVAAGLPTLFVLMRCYTRICLRRVFGVDDSFMVAAVVCRASFFSTNSTFDPSERYYPDGFLLRFS